jgi:hypothetical protein
MGATAATIGSVFMRAEWGIGKSELTKPINSLSKDNG